ncbi:hypothetical protein AGABI2DRAFT_190536 [Agaricus bisporus var. bisporus H97]|uniref:hypothetical protein n=1 Tax=Agaricus bisporus var. bisporus (strain H97 / ATCC MYA-4626 / FGSC 10389) TaxID=936046 RepID=UPI00029F5D64|nr:hypothetical protein AGABI2DRAFT_190536 [Agaricus bisporus var. bisporus H97]EKV50134.1 hypothetical protein AGABI2DRAFT_190536 [Agaricus bisporus var. bisporus H97]
MELDSRKVDSSQSASRHSDHHQNAGAVSQKDTPTIRQEEEQQNASPILSSTIPSSDLSVDFSTIMSSMGSNSADEKIEKRRSNILKLKEENDKLQLELKAMSDRLKAAEEKRARLQAQKEEGNEDSNEDSPS